MGIVAASVVCWLVFRPWIIPTYDRLLALGLGYLAIIAGVVWFLILTASERSQIRRLVKPSS
ncbi:MAG: hypothetical protein EOP84_05725 [Verrucomicrobiaceae bacterium]|nr:MAG: hypothetical protein EOP84_05725 [Verrucomicrobiaceae bacterium]